MLRDAILSIDAEGRITDIATAPDVDSLPGVEFYAGVLLPGLINAHCHLELSAAAGAIPPGGGFTDFGRAMSKLPREVPGRERAIAAQDALMWRQGISAVGDVCNGSASFHVKSGSPISYVNFLELFGMESSSAAKLEDLAASAARQGLKACVTPHSTYSLQKAAFAAAVAATPGAPLSIHFMESLDEGQLFEGRGPMREWYAERGFRPDFTGFGSPCGRLLAQVPQGRDLMLVHNTFVTEDIVEILIDRFSDRLTMVLCPRSNLYITGQLPPVDMLLRKGVRIALGTDSLASNTSLSLVDEMKVFGHIPLEELLRWVTANGAQALGVTHEQGVLEQGKAPGIVLLRNLDLRTLTLTRESEMVRLVP